MTLELKGPPAPEVAHIVAIGIELFLHGIYTYLFFATMHILLKKRKQTASCGTFLKATILMYIVSTADICLNILRALNAYVWQVDPPALYYVDVRRWETIAHISIWCAMTWLGDVLVIYRCWIIWNRSYWIVGLPVILLVMSVVLSIMCLFWLTHFGRVTAHVTEVWMAPIYPLVLAQNVITTGLITLKIWTQYRTSVTNNVVDTSSRLRLGGILRIIIESAAIYTIQMLILVIVTPLRCNIHHIVQMATVPSIGIVFVLITVRVHHSSNSTTFFVNKTPSVLGDLDSLHKTPSTTGFG